MSSAHFEEKPLPLLNHLMHLPHQDTYDPLVTSLASPDVFSHPGSQYSSTRTTPASSFSGSSSAPALAALPPVHEKCTCKSTHNRIPRPRNAFILFRQKNHQTLLDEDSMVRTNPEVSRELGRRWRLLPREEKEYWNRLAEEEKANHAKLYPGYRYTPRRNGKKGNCAACRQKAATQLPVQQYTEGLYGYMMPQMAQMPQVQQMPPAPMAPVMQMTLMPATLQYQQPMLQLLPAASMQPFHYAGYLGQVPAYASSNVPVGVPQLQQLQQFGFGDPQAGVIPAQHVAAPPAAHSGHLSAPPAVASSTAQDKLSPLSSATHMSPFTMDMAPTTFQYDNTMQLAAGSSQTLTPNHGSVNVNLGNNPPRYGSLPNYASYSFESMMPHQS